MHYFISRDQIPTQYIQLKLHLYCHRNEKIQLQLPAWRPGRYDLANYAQKIKKLEVLFEKSIVTSSKITKDLWTFQAGEEGLYVIMYDFHASLMDGGGSWSDDEQLYLNFINFIFEVKGRETESIEVAIDLPKAYKVATALPKVSAGLFLADNFQHLVDSPLIASPTLSHYSYNIGVSNFHLWFQGKINFDVAQLLQVFENFSKKQIEAFGDFPASHYHFLFQLLPYKHYHGVEHQYSTVITIGPAEKLKDKKLLKELVGVSSHELYHFWNVCRIRPKELLPYDFSKEAYIDTGLVAEGVTTYMGDYFLLKSGYFSFQDYLMVLEKLLDREFENFGWQNQSIVASSLDLWLDGYKAGIPEKKVSIYNRGALISLCLDLMLLDNGSSLHKVMKRMWEQYGKTQSGYSLQDYKEILSDCLQEPKTIEDFFTSYVKGTEDILPELERQLKSLGISLEIAPRKSFIESKLGIIVDKKGKILKIHPNSAAHRLFMANDEIKEIDGQKFKQAFRTEKSVLSIKVSRYGREIIIELPLLSGKSYYYKFKLTDTGVTSKRMDWIGTDH